MIHPSNKTAINLAINFFKGNYALSFAAIAILFVISLLNFIPIIGIFFLISYAIFSLSIQIYFAKAIEEIENEEDMEDIAASTKIGEFLNKYFSTAAGGFSGLLIIGILLSIFIGILLAAFGSTSISIEQMQGMNEEQIAMILASTYSIPVLIISLLIGFLFYIFPGVMGYIMSSNDFNEAFKNSFLLLNPKFWSRTFNKKYFLLILFWSIIITIATILLFFLSATVILIPIVIILGYLLSLYNAAIYIFSKELLK